MPWRFLRPSFVVFRQISQASSPKPAAYDCAPGKMLYTNQMQIYWFNWPSAIGGADTKFSHLLRLLHTEYEITVIPNEARYLETPWTAEVRALGVDIKLMTKLPDKLEGWAIALCNGPFLDNGMAAEMKNRGLKIAWSSEMMWHFKGEAAAVQSGLIDKVLYVSPAQRLELEPGYLKMLGGEISPQIAVEPSTEWSGVLQVGDNKLPWVMTGNYIDPDLFPFRERGHWQQENRPFTIGRLSRPDPSKFPDDFPKAYERLGLAEPVKFRVMAWSDDLTSRWSHHEFDSRWELLEPASIPTVDFLRSLDVLVYNTSLRFKESWGRAVVEAMLTGVVPILPRGNGHHLENLVKHQVSGFLCNTNADYGHYARLLQNDSALLKHLSHGTRNWAVEYLCNAEEHRMWWRAVFG